MGMFGGGPGNLIKFCSASLHQRSTWYTVGIVGDSYWGTWWGFLFHSCGIRIPTKILFLFVDFVVNTDIDFQRYCPVNIMSQINCDFCFKLEMDFVNVF